MHILLCWSSVHVPPTALLAVETIALLLLLGESLVWHHHLHVVLPICVVGFVQHAVVALHGGGSAVGLLHWVLWVLRLLPIVGHRSSTLHGFSFLLLRVHVVSTVAVGLLWRHHAVPRLPVTHVLLWVHVRVVLWVAVWQLLLVHLHLHVLLVPIDYPD